MFFYLQKRNQSYYFRTRIPLDIQQWFDTTEIKRSLRTKNHTIAKSQCRLMTSKAEHVFSQIRSGLLAEDQIYSLIEKHFPSRKTNSINNQKPTHFKNVVTAYVDEHVLLGKWTDKTRLEVESTLDLALEIIGDRPLSAIDRAVMVDYVSKLTQLATHGTAPALFHNHLLLCLTHMRESL